MNRILKELNFACPECKAIYRLLEIHQTHQSHCSHNCLTNWKSLLHSHFQDQIILFLAQQEAQAEAQNDHDKTERNDQ